MLRPEQESKICKKKSGGCGKQVDKCTCGIIWAHPFDCGCKQCQAREEEIKNKLKSGKVMGK